MLRQDVVGLLVDLYRRNASGDGGRSVGNVSRGGAYRPEPGFGATEPGRQALGDQNRTRTQRTSMNFKLHECREDRLRVLLEGNEESADFAAAVRHVEHCPDCQRRLGKLAGQAGLIDELKRRRVSENEQFFTGDTDPLENVDPKAAPDLFHPDLGFLLPGSHPEMLGRLGRYEVEKVIGCGGMGVVLKAHDMELNRPVAIKVLAPHLVTSGSARQRFAREGRAAAAILHENVVAIYNVDSESQTPYL